MNGMRECRESRATPLGRRSVESRGVRGYLPGRLGISASRRLVVRDVAQLGSAPEWGSGGRGFKSRRPDWSNGMPDSQLCCLTFLFFLDRECWSAAPKEGRLYYSGPLVP